MTKKHKLVNTTIIKVAAINNATSELIITSKPSSEAAIEVAPKNSFLERLYSNNKKIDITNPSPKKVKKVSFDLPAIDDVPHPETTFVARVSPKSTLPKTFTIR